MGLRDKEWSLVQRLNQAEQRVLDIAMAIAAKPKLLLLDEPTSGLAAEDVPRIIKLIKSLKEAIHGITIILVEHKLEVVKSLADRVIVMHEGRILADGSYHDVVSNREVVEVYLGASIA
jgi:branched-chain amino acid transport system ATP-binding protein